MRLATFALFTAAAIPAVLIRGVSAGTAVLGTGLEPGMQLIYESMGERQPPWHVDSVRVGAGLRPGFDCAVLHIRRRPDAPAEETRLCLGTDTLHRWDARRASWTVARPVGPRMTWSTLGPDSTTVRYETDIASEDTIAGRRIPVILTAVTTTDSAGRPLRRLRERYALSLATATRGAFETPDSARPGTWLVQREFVLREILTPPH